MIPAPVAEWATAGLAALARRLAHDPQAIQLAADMDRLGLTLVLEAREKEGT